MVFDLLGLLSGNLLADSSGRKGRKALTIMPKMTEVIVFLCASPCLCESPCLDLNGA